MKTYSIISHHRTAGGSWEPGEIVASGLDSEIAVHQRRELARADDAARTKGSLARNWFEVVVDAPAPVIDPRQLSLFPEVSQ